MQIPALAPDIWFTSLATSSDGLAFSFDVKRAALGPYVEQKWGWIDGYQLEVHRHHFAEKPFFAIERDRMRIGTVSLFKQEDFLRFGEFYLFPAEQRKGLGTRILEHCLRLSDDFALPVRLEYLKWNPVGALYRRHGFEVIGETDIHWLMERPRR